MASKQSKNHIPDVTKMVGKTETWEGEWKQFKDITFGRHSKLWNYSKKDTIDRLEVHIDYIRRTVYQQGRKDEAERWLHQPANEHDQRIRAEAIEEVEDEVQKMIYKWDKPMDEMPDQWSQHNRALYQ